MPEVGTEALAAPWAAEATRLLALERPMPLRIASSDGLAGILDARLRARNSRVQQLRADEHPTDLGPSSGLLAQTAGPGRGIQNRAREILRSEEALCFFEPLLKFEWVIGHEG